MFKFSGFYFLIIFSEIITYIFPNLSGSDILYFLLGKMFHIFIVKIWARRSIFRLGKMLHIFILKTWARRSEKIVGKVIRKIRLKMWARRSEKIKKTIGKSDRENKTKKLGSEKLMNNTSRRSDFFDFQLGEEPFFQFCSEKFIFSPVKI